MSINGSGITTEEVSSNLLLKRCLRARRDASILYKVRIDSGIFVSSPELNSELKKFIGEVSFLQERKDIKTRTMIRLFKIGTEVIEVPVERKFKKGEKIKFKRYGKLPV